MPPETGHLVEEVAAEERRRTSPAPQAVPGELAAAAAASCCRGCGCVGGCYLPALHLPLGSSTLLALGLRGLLPVPAAPAGCSCWLPLRMCAEEPLRDEELPEALKLPPQPAQQQPAQEQAAVGRMK